MSAPVTLITGCASGIGRALVACLTREGHQVLASDVDLEGLLRAAEEDRWPGDRVHTTTLDVRDAAAWERACALAAERFLRLDVLCNVAGYLRPGYCHEQSADEIERHIDINVKGTLHGTLAASRRMVAQGSGHIINISSLAGIAPIPGLSLYSASKFAVRGFSLAIAAELKPHKVHVTVICPDAVKTPMLDKQLAFDEAALTFSGKQLSTADVTAAVVSALDKRPLELLLPPSRGRLAQLASLTPRVQPLLAPLLKWRGKKTQARLRRGTP